MMIGTGWVAMTSLMAVHASYMLDVTAELPVCWLFDDIPEHDYSPVQSLAGARQRGRFETNWDPIETAGEPLKTYHEGSWARLDPLMNPFNVIHPSRAVD